jgi:CheY-like chemotaxis protein
MGGELGVRSAVGEGSTFYADIPLRVMRSRAQSRTATTERVGIAQVSPCSPLQNVSRLVLPSALSVPLAQPQADTMQPHAIPALHAAPPLTLEDPNKVIPDSLFRRRYAAVPGELNTDEASAFESRWLSQATDTSPRRARHEVALARSPRIHVSFENAADAKPAVATLLTRRKADSSACDVAPTGSVCIPMAAVADAARAHAVARATTAAQAPAPTLSAPVHILVTDDSDTQRRLVCRILRIRFPNSCITEAKDGDEACALMAKSKVAGDALFTTGVVCMDKEMPVCDGFEATARIREMGFEGLVLGVTGNALAPDTDAFLNHGADAVVIKPISVDVLFESIRQFVELGCRRGPVSPPV